AFRKTWKSDFTIDDIPSTMKDKKEILEAMNSHPICTFIGENEHSEVCRMGSTDVGDVSWVVPTATISVACYSLGAEGHSWQWVAQGRSSIAAKGMMKAAEVLARGAVRLYEDQDLIEKAKAEFNGRLEGEKYECLIPHGVKPHVI
ncbi:MAG: amidohydrolase, partial [Clostridia bacterium]|nr:amidohydrolase [Clostridia bacterium]